MNFLAHLLLAGGEQAHQIGGLLGDFVKGPLPGSLPADLALGVALHRQIDVQTDAHPLFRQSCGRISPARRRVAGIMVDLFYDHFLVCHWRRFCEQSLGDYLADFYATLAQRHDQLPARLQGLWPRMRDEAWLESYGEVDSVGWALNSLARRRTRLEAFLLGGGEELLWHYAELEQDFLALFPQLQDFSQSWLAGAGGARGTGLGDCP